MIQKTKEFFFALTKIFEIMFDTRKIRFGKFVNIEMVFFSILLIVLCLFQYTSSNILETNIHLVEELVGHYSETKPDRTPAEARSILKDLQTTFWFSSIFFYLCMYFSGRVNPYIGANAKRSNLFLLQPQIPVLIVALFAMGFCVQLGMYDPLYQRIKGNGFSQFSFQFSFSKWKDPLLFPSLCMLSSAAVLFVNWFVKNKSADFSVFKTNRSGIIEFLFGRFFRLFGATNQSLIYVVILPLLVSLLVVVLVAAGGSAFSSGVTILEPLKQAIMALIVLLFVHHQRNRPFEHIPAPKPRQELLVLGAIILMGVGIGSAGDIGALIIITYSMVLVFSLWYQRNRAWNVKGLYYLIISSALFVIPAMKWIPSAVLDERRRFREWRMGDGVFLHSGIGDNFLPGTASSPDFARAEWSLASASFTGRGTSLFVDAGSGDPFAAYLAYGHNDRIIVTLAETFGLLGVFVCLGLYALLILSLLATFAQTFKGFNKLTSGIALASGCIIFGQVYVHTGGNLGLLPFTGIVLPFISHGTTANSCFFALVMLCSMRSYSILYKNVGVDEDKENRFKFRIISGSAFLFFSVLVVWSGYKILIESPRYATYVRYGVQNDLSMKVTYNPRLYVLSDLLDAKARVVDQNDLEVRTEEGFQFANINNEDRTMLGFLHENKDVERGYRAQEVSQYFETKCYLHGLDYSLFGGAYTDSDEEKYQAFQEIYRRGSIYPPLNGKECVIPDPPVVGSFFTDLGNGTVDGLNCIIDGIEYKNTGEHLISYFDAQGNYINPEEKETSRCTVKNLFGTSSSIEGTTGSYWFQKSCTIPTQKQELTDDLVAKQAEKNTKIIERHIEWDGDRCVVHTTHVGCKVDDTIYGPRNVRLDMNNDNESSIGTIASRSLFFNHFKKEKIVIDQKLSKKDTECSIQNYTIGELAQSQKNKQNITMFTEKKMKKLVSDNFNLGKFARLDVDEQLRIKGEKEREIRNQTLRLELDARLQDKVQAIIKEELRVLEKKGTKAPSIQSLIFNTESGDILAQNQITRPRADLKKLYRAKEYEKIFTLDRGEYGFGRNLHYSYMLPASTFKVYHAMAAVLTQKSNFTTQCRGKSKKGKKYRPENVSWRAGINCNGNHGKVSLIKALNKSCNHYFMDMAFLNKTYPDSLQYLCEELGVSFGRSDSCTMSSRTWESALETRGAGQDSFGQGAILFNMYQLAGVLQSLSNNQKPDLCTNLTAREDDPCFNDKSPLVEIQTTDIFQDIFEGMEQKNKDFQAKGLRVYGKTGTGQEKLHRKTLKTKVKDPSVIQGTLQTNGSCSLKRGSIGNPCWVRDYEKPYGVTKDEDHSLFFALIESEAAPKYAVGTQRVGIVIRIPRGGKSSNAKRVANRIILEAIQPLRLVPAYNE